MTDRKYKESGDRFEDPEWCAKWDSHPFLGEFLGMCQEAAWAFQDSLANPVAALEDLGFALLSIVAIWLFFFILGA